MMRARRRDVFLVLLLAVASLCAPAARAQGLRAEGPLSLAEVQRAVLEQHPLLAAAEQERAIAGADVLSAQGGFDPTLRARVTSIPVGPYPSDRLETLAELPTGLGGTRFFGGYRVSRGDFAIYDGKLVTGDHGEARVGAQVPLWRDGPIDRRRAALQRAELGTGVAQLNVEQQRLEVMRAAAHRYWDWVAAGRRLTIAREMLAIAVARDVGLGSRVARGDLPALERVENERVTHQRSAAVAVAERALQGATIELSLYLRGADGTPRLPDPARLPVSFPPSGTRMMLDEGVAERQAVLHRPELKRFELLAQQTRVDRTLAENQRKLGLDFYIAGAKDFGPIHDRKLLKPELELALVLDIPIFTRTQDGRFQAAEANLGRLEQQTRFARDRLTADVRDATSAIRMSEERILATGREVATSRQLVEMERQRFELGEGTLLLVNLREQSLAEARQREVDALADYFKALASQRAAIGASPVDGS